MTQISQFCDFALLGIMLMSSDPKINTGCKTAMEKTSTGTACKTHLL